MLKRVLPDVFGTLECICAAEKMMSPPGSQIGRICGIELDVFLGLRLHASVAS